MMTGVVRSDPGFSRPVFPDHLDEQLHLIDAARSVELRRLNSGYNPALPLDQIDGFPANVCSRCPVNFASNHFARVEAGALRRA